MRYTLLDSPIGELLIAGDRDGLSQLSFREGARAPAISERWRHDPDFFAAARDQLAAYFEGSRQAFELELAPRGSTFQRQVWRTLREVPYGTTISYGELAARISKPKAVRAVGAANGANPIAVIIPCHRVIGADGSLTGYGGGLDVKERLLAHEGARLAF